MPATDTLPTKDAATLLGCAPATLARLSHTFRLVNDKAGGRIHWRADVIRTAAGMRDMSVEKRLEAAIRVVEG